MYMEITERGHKWKQHLNEMVAKKLKHKLILEQHNQESITPLNYFFPADDHDDPPTLCATSNNPTLTPTLKKTPPVLAQYHIEWYSIRTTYIKTMYPTFQPFPTQIHLLKIPRGIITNPPYQPTNQI